MKVRTHGVFLMCFEMLVHLSFNDNLAGKLNEHDEALLELCSTFR